MMRLDRLLSSRGYCTRGEAPRFLRKHEVLHGTEPVRKSDMKVDPSAITIDGEAIDPGEGLTLMLNKPCGYTCSRDDAGALIYELLPERFGRRNPPLVTVGRLDKETSGLLLFSDDGQLVHRLTSPKSKVPKVYRAVLSRPLSEADVAVFASGSLMLANESKPAAPARLEILSEREARVTLTEGRYHQVRRMFAAIGNHVEGLQRTKIGSLELGDLAEGSFKIMSAEDIAAASSAQDG